MQRPLITSTSNPLIKQARALRQKKARNESGLFLVEGIHHVGEVVEAGWETVMMQFPAAGDPATSQYQVTFRYFRRLEGTFKIAAEDRVLRVEARLVQDGAVKASQSVTL